MKTAIVVCLVLNYSRNYVVFVDVWAVSADAVDWSLKYFKLISLFIGFFKSKCQLKKYIKLDIMMKLKELIFADF